MDPDDEKIEDDIAAIIANIGNTSTWTVSPGVTVDDISWNIFGDNDNDNSYDVTPVPNQAAIYTSHEQREQHEKYPALQKAWEDYLSMYALTKGEPPVVE